MRKTLEAVGLALLAALYWTTWNALHGANPLPERIPTHFDASGQANGWGAPESLWMLPIIATGMYLLMTVVGSLRLNKFSLPVPITPANLPFIQEKTKLLIALIKIETLGLVLFLQRAILQAARESAFRLSSAFVFIFLAVVLASAIWYQITVVRGAKRLANGDESSSQPLQPR